MRYIVLLHKENPSDNVKYSKENVKNVCHAYDNTLCEKYKLLNTEYNTDDNFRESFRKITIASHPFEIINSNINSSYVNSKSIKITNAFMKIFEMMMFLDEYLDIENNTLTMFDIGSAPGMFIFGVEYYLKKYRKDTRLDWFGCSSVGGTSLNDTYKLYSNNPTNFCICDVLKNEDILKIVNMNKKYKLVTGDIGIFHDDNYDTLQEYTHLELQYKQMYLALSTCDIHGCMVLKMFSLITNESIYLIDTLTQYFENVYISKPYTSRIFNDESYLICINRNSIPSTVDIDRKYIESYHSRNIQLVNTFEHARLDLKLRMKQYLTKLITKNNDNSKIFVLRSNKEYELYYEEFEYLYNIFTNISREKKLFRNKRNIA